MNKFKIGDHVTVLPEFVLTGPTGKKYRSGTIVNTFGSVDLWHIVKHEDGVTFSYLKYQLILSAQILTKEDQDENLSLWDDN